MDPINAVLEWQRNFNHTDIHAYMSTHDEVPVLFTCLYLALIFYVPELLAKSPPAKYLAWPLTLWNLVLAVFSCLGCYFLGAEFVRLVSENGLRWSVCTKPEASHCDGAIGFWLVLFVLSKIPEMMDTVFLVLRKRPVIFLHAWHHLTVALYTWHAYVHRIGPGWWFSAINYGAHALLYWYYCLMTFGSPVRRVVKRVAPIITFLQLFQMFVGLFILLAQRWYKHTETADAPCEAYHEANNRLGLGMYFSYAILFGVLFRNLYCVPRTAGGDGDDEEGAPRGGRNRKSAAGSVTAPDQSEICHGVAAAMNELHSTEPRNADRGKDD